MYRGMLACAAACAVALGGCSASQPSSGAKTASVADIAGSWHFVAVTPAGHQEATMYVEQRGGDISGRFEGELGVMHYQGTVGTQQVRFGHLAMAGAMRFEYTGDVVGEEMRGTAVFGTLGDGTWTATRTSRK